MAIILEAHGYRLTAAPEYGATILAAEWRRGDGEWLAILEPLLQPQDALNAGCFVMAPFANRIYGGSFSFKGDTISFPMNRPLSHMACHGFARDFSWDIFSLGDDAASLGCEPSATGYPWSFSITQNLSLSPAGIVIELSMRNTGAAALPFGFGLHPWFPRPDGTMLSFKADGAYHADSLGLPLPVVEPQPAFDPASPVPLEKAPAIDRCFAGWNPAEARIDWPSRRMALALRASGALRHIHVYLPESRPVVCVEPVSHVPDAVNRTNLGRDAAMTVLSPGETLNGSMTLRAFAIDTM